MRLALLCGVTLALAGCSTGVTVRWTTETELDTAGFHLYRSESPTGPFTVRVTEALIPASGGPVAGSDYRYLDSSAVPGVTYYYELHEVETNGSENRFGPIEARVSGFSPARSLALVALAAAALALWWAGGRVAGARRAGGRPDP
jgi:hypothetical protein